MVVNNFISISLLVSAGFGALETPTGEHLAGDIDGVLEIVLD
jgi:hypothetical protein